MFIRANGRFTTRFGQSHLAKGDVQRTDHRTANTHHSMNTVHLAAARRKA